MRGCALSEIMKSQLVWLCVFELFAAVILANSACKTHYGRFRDCTCGVQYRDVETRCCSQTKCSVPEVRTENLTCPLTCLNNGQKLFDTSSQIGCRCRGSYGGTCCEKVRGSCGNVLFNWKGEIKSPSSSTSSPNSVNCTWTIKTDPLRRISLSARSFDLKSGMRCMCNYIIVHDGNKMTRFCGQYFPTVHSRTNELTVQSYGRPSEGVFHLDYQTYYIDQQCGPKKTFHELNGVITSPQYPLNYAPMTICTWAIKVWPGYGLVVKFQNINIHETVGCLSDYVFVSKTDKSGRRSIITKLCGNRDNVTIYISNAIQVRVRFASNSRTEGKGFKLSYYSRKLYHYIYG